MPIEKKPEQIVLSGDEARQAVIDGVQRKLDRKIDEKTIVIAAERDSDAHCDNVSITVDVIGSLKGAKASAKRGPRKPKPSTAV